MRAVAVLCRDALARGHPVRRRRFRRGRRLLRDLRLPDDDFAPADTERRGRVFVLGFYARRIRRLLPAAAAALAGTALITVLVLPPIRWADTARRHRLRRALRSELAVRQPGGRLPAARQRAQPGPALLVAVRRGAVLSGPPGAPALVCLVALTPHSGGSPSAAVVVAGRPGELRCTASRYTHSDPSRAYFVTTTRVWELALGGVIAVAAPLPAPTSDGGRGAVRLAWPRGGAGGCRHLLRRHGVPGRRGALPTLGTAAVIAGGIGGPGAGPSLALRSRPLAGHRCTVLLAVPMALAVSGRRPGVVRRPQRRHLHGRGCASPRGVRGSRMDLLPVH